MLIEFERFPSSLLVYMSAYMTEALEDLAGPESMLPPPDLWDRFLGWIDPGPPRPTFQDYVAGRSDPLRSA
ncbi:hypothetical protein [Winogradskya consettensis]|uniref:hypothetical protein n=1 Tax=Winogradskya consettensis TaxID=113560 RepID=UPI001BB2FFA3|nr:hypothetical protein [Actinoplanes consettensis]